MEIDRCRDLRASFPAFVTDSVDATVEARIREHLSLGCAVCAAEIGRLDTAFYALPRALRPEPFLEGGAEAMLSAITRQPQEQPEVPILFPDGRPLRVAWTVALLCALALGAAAVWGRGQQSAVFDAEQRAAAEMRQTRRVLGEFGELQAAHDGARTLLDRLTDPTTQVVELIGELGSARAFVAAEPRTLLFTTPGLPTGQTYELVIAFGGAATPLGPIEPKIAQSGGGRQYELPPGLESPSELQVRRADGGIVLRGPLELP